MRQDEAEWRLEIAFKVELFYWILLIGYVVIVSLWPGFVSGWDTVLFGAVYTIYIPLFHRRFMPYLLHYRPQLATIIDELMGLIFISVIVFLTGGWLSPFFFLYFFPILFAALLHRGADFVSPWWVVLTELALLGVMAFDTQVHTAILTQPALAAINIGALVVIAAVVTSILMTLQESWRSRAEAERAQRLAQDAHDKLKELDAAKNEFIATATHELSTPITIAKGRLSMALEEDRVKLSPEARRYFESVSHSVNRLGALVRDILTVSQLDAGRLKVVTGSYPLPHLVKSALVKIPAVERVRIKHTPPKRAVPHILADAGKATEAIEKVIENAIKFTAQHTEGKKSSIAISYSLSAEHVLAHIDDQGPGIGAHERRRIFERFAQVNRATQEQQGSGLGLYIARELMRLNKGYIEVSEYKKGTRFTLGFVRVPEQK